MAFTLPSQPIAANVADPIALTWIANDPDSPGATIDFLLDGDGSLATSGDTFTIAAGLPLLHNVGQAQVFDLPSGASGSMSLFARANDGTSQVDTRFGFPVDVANVSFLKTVGGALDDLGVAVSALAGGDVAWAGEFWGVATFGFGELHGVTLDAGAERDFFVARHRPDGTLAGLPSPPPSAPQAPWLAWISSVHDFDEFGDFCQLTDGTVLACGEFTGPLTFHRWGANPVVLQPVGNNDGFLARYDSNCDLVPGTPLRFGKDVAVTSNPVYVAISCLAAASDGGFAMTGAYNGFLSFVIGQPASSLAPMSSPATDDAYVARYGPDLAFSWAARIGGTGVDAATHVAHTSDGGLIVVGYFVSACTVLGAGAAGLPLTSNGGRDGFIAKYTASGQVEWARAIGGSSVDSVTAVAILPTGEIAVCGAFTDSAFVGDTPSATIVALNPGVDSFVAFYDAQGQYLRSVVMGASNDDNTGDLSLDADGHLLVCGGFNGATGTTASFGTLSLPCNGTTDGFAAAIDPNFAGAAVKVRWVTGVRGPGTDRVVALAGLADGTTALTGWFTDHASFGTPPNTAHSPPVVGGQDMYVGRVHRDGSY